MKITKAVLLKCGRKALEARGYSTQQTGGQRITPGSRLEATKDARTHAVAVRTSRQRELGLLREPDRRWRTVSSVEEVIVVARSRDEEMAADVMSFDSELLCQIFDAAVREHMKDDPGYPVFIPLDDTKKEGVVVPGLKSKAAWQSTVWIAENNAHEITASVSQTGFVERVKREFAELMGVDVSKVSVDFRITE